MDASATVRRRPAAMIRAVFGGWELAAIAGAGLAAGTINSVVGGGSLITFPVLVAAGVPPLTANLSNTVALCPGYVGAVAGYRRELVGQGARMRLFGAVSAVGAAIGVALLTSTSQRTFGELVPALVLLATALVAVQPLVSRRLHARRAGREGPLGPVAAAVFAASIYGAYFGGGLGVLLIAIFAIGLVDRLQRLNALNRWINLVVNAVAAATFIVVGPIDWTVVALLAPTALLASRFGVGLARRLSDRLLRAVVVAFGLAASVYLFAT